MDWVNLVSMIVGILSLLATIAISVVIYILQKKDAMRERKRELKQQACDFIMENIDEKEYLVLAQFATRLYPQHKHNRKIYNLFIRCDSELQKEILKQANFTDLKLEVYDDDFCYKMLKLFEKDADKMQLFTKTFLYDGAKYFFRGLQSHGNTKLMGNLNIDKNNNVSQTEYLPNYLYNKNGEMYHAIAENEIWLRLLDYSLFQSGGMTEDKFNNIKRFGSFGYHDQIENTKFVYSLPKTYSEFKEMHKIPPLDYYWFLVTSASEDECVYIVMEMVRQGSLLINRENNKEWLNPFEGEYEIERNEDLFYATLQTLFCTYSKKLNKN